jgi:arrestin-related trafficking adapter 3/6
MRLSRPDATDPTKRRHFEISIDSPFHILSCRATQANISLPAYSVPESADASQRLYECGCPGAPVRRNSPTAYVPTLNNLNPNNANRNSWSPGQHPNGTHSAGLTRPQPAHVSGPANAALARPMHIIRVPSFNPPAFEEEEPPPPLETPPPQYDTIASPTSGLADYFQRFSNHYSEDSESEGQRTPTGRMRVEVPLTPGARAASRSMDIPRAWAPLVGASVPSGALTGPSILRAREREQTMSSATSEQSLASTGSLVGVPTIEPSAAVETASVTSFHTSSSGSSSGSVGRPVVQRS